MILMKLLAWRANRLSRRADDSPAVLLDPSVQELPSQVQTPAAKTRFLVSYATNLLFPPYQPLDVHSYLKMQALLPTLTSKIQISAAVGIIAQEKANSGQAGPQFLIRAVTDEGVSSGPNRHRQERSVDQRTPRQPI